MAAYSLAAPGTEYGPCIEPCKHTDCAKTRKDAESTCLICGKPIGYEVSIYFTDAGIEHYVCYHKKRGEN